MGLKYTITIVATILALNICQAQLQDRNTEPDGSGQGFLELLPPDYNSNPTKTYPLMLFLHGRGERGDGTPEDLNKVKRHGPTLEASRGHDMCFTVNGVEECFILIAPQLGSNRSGWGTRFVDPMLLYALDNYRVDETRIYLTGLSLGAGGVYRYAPATNNLPNRLAAISAIAGWGRPDPDGCIISERKMAMWSFHGDQDRTVGYNSGLAMYRGVSECDNPVPTEEIRFTTYEGVGHNSWSRAYRTDNSLHTPNLYEWLLTKNLGENPTANAGPDVTITLPTNSVTLNGSGSDSNGTIASYSWSKTSGGTATLSNEDTPNLTVTDLLVGTYGFTLTVTDNEGNTGTDQALVIVEPDAVNQVPSVSGGADINITLPTNSTNIIATASDSDGTITSYQWTQRSGPNSATITGASNPTVTVADLVEGTYRFRITVQDNGGASSFDNVDVTVNPAAANTSPTADAGSDIILNLPTNTTILSGSGSDSDGTITSYLWEKISGPAATLTNATTPTLTASDLQEGVYTFRLSVTDNDGATGTDEAMVTVVNTNQNPTANAGTDVTITLPTSTATLNGSGSDPDGSINGFSWAQIGGPSTAVISNNSNAVTGVSALVAEGTYRFRLTVTDDDGATATDVVRVFVNAAPVNSPPTADAGEDVSITLPTNSVTLNGSGSDSDGTIASYNWTRVSGPASFTLQNETTATLTVNDLVAGSYTFRLTVTDDDGATADSDVNVNVAPEEVNQLPSVNAGTDVSITLPTNSITLNGTAADPDGTVNTILWTQLSGPSSATLSGESTLALNASSLVAGTYVFQLTVTDNDNASASDNVSVVVSAVNQPPIVSAGPDINLVLPDNDVTIDGSVVDPDGLIITTNWVQIGGPTSTYSVSGNQLIVTDLVEATYTFQLLARDDDNAVSTDDVNIIVTATNILPTVNAGPDINIILPVSSVNLTGTASDADGTISSYSWSKVSGPAATLSNDDTPTLTASNLIEGTYVFSLTAEDNDGDAATDDVIVTVSPEVTNTPPVANAGVNLSITLPTNVINITGSGSDNDGSIASYSWTKTSGPSVTIVNGDNPTMTARDLVEGTYVFTLTVTDDDGDQDSDNMRLVVNPEIVNQTPTANAGPDIQIVLPTNSTNIVGSGNDPDGSISQYQWNLLSGPSTPTLSGATLPTLTATNLVEGTYNFELEVTDNDGATDSDLMILVVSPEAANILPIADAGPDQMITLPTNVINISGSGSDSDGSITGYSWTKVAGPAATISNANTPNITVSNLVEGVYTFQLTVTDNDGDTGSDEMVLQVFPETINQSPIVNAGEDITLQLPQDNTTVNGTASDDDGTVVSLLWEKVNGGDATLINTDQSTLSASALQEGSYTFRLTATDDGGAIGSDEVDIIVLAAEANNPPVVTLGDDITVFLPEDNLELSSTAADSDGSISAYLWEKVSGPTVSIAGLDQATVMLSNLLEGIYVFNLTVTDNEGAEGSDDITITVLPEEVNEAPTANAGPDVFIEQPENSVSLNGSGNDSDGDITSYEWQFIDGPLNPTMNGADSPTLSANGLNDEGRYRFRLIVTDDGGLTGDDEVTVFVSVDDRISNNPPTADAGQDRQIVLPENEVMFIAIAEDDGLIETYSWEQLMGPSDVALSGLDSDTLIVTNLALGQYIFQVTVEDDLGAQAQDQVSLNVIDFETGNPTESSAMNVFSPNGDGQNDLWILDESNLLFSDCEVIIFNDQGSEVFRTLNYQNNWDGTLGGEELKEGVYFYVIRCNGSSDNQVTGSITLIR